MHEIFRINNKNNLFKLCDNLCSLDGFNKLGLEEDIVFAKNFNV